jgi:hypothetical protein
VKTIYCAVVVALLALTMASVAMADIYIYPTVAFEFVPDDCIYRYTVTVTASDSFPLGYLELDTFVKNGGLTPFTMEGPVADAIDLDWSTMTPEWQDPGPPIGPCDSAIWYVDKSRNQVEINPQAPGFTTWVGVYTLIVPNTEPRDGMGLTMDGLEESAQSFTIIVPGPAPIPEPSGMIALGGSMIGLGGILLRRRKA